MAVQPSSLVLALQHAELLDPTVRAELEQFAAILQNWASKIQASDGSISVQGMGTFLGQPCVKLRRRSVQAVPNATLTMVGWDRALSGNPLEECDDLKWYDGSQFVAISEPGTYYAQAEVQWDINAVGYRTISLLSNIPSGIALAYDVREAAGVVGPRNSVSTMFQVIQGHPLGSAIVPFPLLLGVQAYQTSGGVLNLGVNTDRLTILKVS